MSSLGSDAVECESVLTEKMEALSLKEQDQSQDSDTFALHEQDHYPDFQVTEAHTESFDKYGVSNELLEVKQEMIDNLLKFGAKGAPLTPQIRDASLRMLAQLSQLMGMSLDGWFETATILDMYCLRAATGPDVIANLPVTCAAIVKMLKKIDCVGLNLQGAGANLSMYATQLSQWLQSYGYTVIEPTEERLIQQERAVLQALGWQINLPTIQSMVTMFCTRFNILTQYMFNPSVTWVWEKCSYFAKIILFRQPVNKTNTPKRLACGLLCMTFVMARLLPMEILRRKTDGASTWENFFSQNQSGTGPSSVLGHAVQVFRLLSATTASTSDELIDATDMVGTVLMDAMAAMADMSGGGPRPPSPVATAPPAVNEGSTARATADVTPVVDRYII